MRDKEGWGCKIILLPVLLSFTYSTELPIWAIKLRHQHRNRKGHVDKNGVHLLTNSALEVLNYVTSAVCVTNTYSAEQVCTWAVKRHVTIACVRVTYRCQTKLCQSHMFKRRSVDAPPLSFLVQQMHVNVNILWNLLLLCVVSECPLISECTDSHCGRNHHDWAKEIKRVGIQFW